LKIVLEKVISWPSILGLTVGFASHRKHSPKCYIAMTLDLNCIHTVLTTGVVYPCLLLLEFNGNVGEFVLSGKLSPSLCWLDVVLVFLARISGPVEVQFNN